MKKIQKLELSRETLRRLARTSIEPAVGGYYTEVETCSPSCFRTVCTQCCCI